MSGHSYNFPQILDLGMLASSSWICIPGISRNEGSKTCSWVCSGRCCLGPPPAHQLPHAPLHVFVPQAVDQRLQHGGQNHVNDRSHPVLEGVAGQGSEININNTSIKEGHHGEVGATGRESFTLPSNWGDLKNSNEDPEVRDDNAYKGGSPGLLILLC